MMKKVWQWLGGCLATVAVLVGCSSPQQTFIQRYELLSASGDKPLTQTFELSVPELEFSEEIIEQTPLLAQVTEMLKGMKIRGKLSQDVSNQAMSMTAKIAESYNLSLPELEVIVTGKEAFVNVDFMLLLLQQQGLRVTGLEQFSGKLVNLKTLAEQSGNQATVEQYEGLYTQQDVEQAAAGYKQFIEKMKAMPADRFTQEGDKVIAKLGIDDWVKLLHEESQDVSADIVQTLKDLYQDITVEYIVDTKQRSMGFKVTMVGNNVPVKRIVLSLEVNEQAFEGVRVPSADEIVTPEQIREAVPSGASTTDTSLPTPAPAVPTEVSDEDFAIGLENMREFFATGEGSTYTQEEREAYYATIVDNNTTVVFSDAQKEALRKVIFNEE